MITLLLLNTLASALPQTPPPRIPIVIFRSLSGGANEVNFWFLAKLLGFFMKKLHD